jgi:photosystem II stability/assembly factor-like uncharacterized protein
MVKIALARMALALTAILVPATTAATAASLPTAAVPSTFGVLSVTFASPTLGWVFGSVPCSGHRCAELAHTTNAGRTWSLLPAPPVTINSQTGSLEPSHGVSSVRFATSLDGWLFGPELWSTHDGGRTWQRDTVYGAHDGRVLALETARGTAHAVLNDLGADFRIATVHVGHDDWAVVHQALPIGAGPIPSIQLALAGTGGWILQNDRTAVNGARLVNGTWTSWRPACGSAVGPGYLAAVSSSTLFAVCDVGAFSTPAGEHLDRSTNAGTTFVRRGVALPTYPGQAAAAASTMTVAVVGSRGSSTVLAVTFNGGSSWTRELTFAPGAIVDLGFTTPTQGVVVNAGRLFMTRDGGHAWSRVTL